MADTRIHILGSFQNIRICRRGLACVCLFPAAFLAEREHREMRAFVLASGPATHKYVFLQCMALPCFACLSAVHACRDAICALIMGSPPGKVYSKLRSVCSHLNSSY